MSDSKNRASRIGLAVPITPPKDIPIMSTHKDVPPPQYPGRLDHEAFENIVLDQMDNTGTPLSAPPRPREEPNIQFYRPAPRLKRRFYIMALIALAVIGVCLATFAGILVRNQPSAQKDASTTPNEPNTSALPWRPTTVFSVSTATPMTTLVTVTTQTNDNFEITVLPSHTTAVSLQLQVPPAGTRKAV